MSIKSTYYVSREIAQQVLLSNIFKLTDTELADALEGLPQSTFRNYRVGDFDNDLDYTITSVLDFDYK